MKNNKHIQNKIAESQAGWAKGTGIEMHFIKVLTVNIERKTLVLHRKAFRT